MVVERNLLLRNARCWVRRGPLLQSFQPDPSMDEDLVSDVLAVGELWVSGMQARDFRKPGLQQRPYVPESLLDIIASGPTVPSPPGEASASHWLSWAHWAFKGVSNVGDDLQVFLHET